MQDTAKDDAQEVPTAPSGKTAPALREDGPVMLSPIERLPITEAAERVIQILTRERCRVLLAGGAVRDHLMGRPAKDIDLCTNASPEQLVEILERHGIKVLPVGQSFGVVVAIVGGEQIEIATFRTDGYSSDGRRPDSVTLGVDPAEDAKRRDLTINGLFYDPVEHIIIDHVGGAQDMAEKVLRFIGNPEDRISEDKLRMMRYLRFLMKTGFSRDAASEAAIQRNADKIKGVSKERIKDEMEKMLAYGPISKILEHLSVLGLLPYVLPEAAGLIGKEQIAADRLPSTASPELKWAALLYEAGPGAADKFCKRLKFSNDERQKVVYLCQNVARVAELSSMDPVKARHFVFDKDLAAVNTHFEDLLLLARAINEAGGGQQSQALNKALQTYSTIKLEAERRKNAGIDLKRLITGNDIMEKLGIKGGPEVGRLQAAVQDRLLLDAEPTRESALRYLDEIESSS
jgi:poly(A) polymerase